MLDATDDESRSSNSNGEQTGQSVIQTSNTWTLSSGGVVSEPNDVDDRTEFVDEYNRLAVKVSSCLASNMLN